MIDSTIVKPIIGASFSLFKADRKMARDVSTIMRRLTDESRGDTVRCQSLTAYGVLDAAERMVLVNDMRQKSAAVSSLVARDQPGRKEDDYFLDSHEFRDVLLLCC